MQIAQIIVMQKYDFSYARQHYVCGCSILYNQIQNEHAPIRHTDITISNFRNSNLGVFKAILTPCSVSGSHYLYKHTHHGALELGYRETRKFMRFLPHFRF